MAAKRYEILFRRFHILMYLANNFFGRLLTKIVKKRQINHEWSIQIFFVSFYQLLWFCFFFFSVGRNKPLVSVDLESQWNGWLGLRIIGSGKTGVLEMKDWDCLFILGAWIVGQWSRSRSPTIHASGLGFAPTKRKVNFKKDGAMLLIWHWCKYLFHNFEFPYFR